MKGFDSFDRNHIILALVLFVIITLFPLVMALHAGYGSVIPVFSDTQALLPIAKNLAVSACCTLVSVILGLLGAKILAEYHFHPKWLFRPMCILGLCAPVASLSFSYSIIESLVSFKPSIPLFNQAMALVVSNTPLMILIVGSHWMALSDDVKESALTLGTKRARIFRTLTLPYLRSAIWGSCALVFIRCMAEFLSDEPVISFAISILAVIVLCICFFTKGRNESIRVVHQTSRPSGFGAHLFVALYCLVLFCAVLAGPLALLYSALMQSGAFGSDAFAFLCNKDLYSDILAALPASVVAVFFASRLSYAIKTRKLPPFMALIALGAAFSFVSEGFSSFGRIIPKTPQIVLDILSWTVCLIPVAVLLTIPRFQAVDPNLKKQASTLGYGPGASYRSTEAKLTGSAVVASWLILMAICIEEFTSNIMASGISGTEICALASSSALICFILLLVGSRLLRKAR